MLDLSLDKRIFRVSPAYSLIAADRLQDWGKQGQAVDGHFGMFVPKYGREKQSRSFPASCEAALLHLSLRKPSLLPFHLRSQLDVPMSDRIGQLLLAGVLEVELDGEFVTGFRAIRLLESSLGHASSRAASSTVALSDAALEYAYRYCQSKADGSDERSLTRNLIRCLYEFNTVPPSRMWRDRLSSDAAVLEYLHLVPGSAVREAQLGTEWTFYAAEPDGWWHHWHPVRTGKGFDRSQLRSRVWSGDTKLYISPVIADLPRTLEITLPIIYRSAATGLKIGKSLSGLTRPDKMVAYFSCPEDLLETSSILIANLKEIDAQGVPFTADLTENGLLSWGSDVPMDGSPNPRAGKSWRMWVAEVLSNSLLEALKQGHTIDQALPYVKTTAEFAGIDTHEWRPKAHLLETSV